MGGGGIMVGWVEGMVNRGKKYKPLINLLKDDNAWVSKNVRLRHANRGVYIYKYSHMFSCINDKLSYM